MCWLFVMIIIMITRGSNSPGFTLFFLLFLFDYDDRGAPKETKHKAPKPKRKLKKKERKEYIKYKILTSRKPQNETTQMLTKERGGGRENRKEETEWLMAVAGYRYNVRKLSGDGRSTQRHERREKRESKTRSEMSDLGHLCYHNAYTLWTMDPWRGSPTKLLWL